MAPKSLPVSAQIASILTRFARTSASGAIWL